MSMAYAGRARPTQAEGKGKWHCWVGPQAKQAKQPWLGFAFGLRPGEEQKLAGCALALTTGDLSLLEARRNHRRIATMTVCGENAFSPRNIPFHSIKFVPDHVSLVLLFIRYSFSELKLREDRQRVIDDVVHRSRPYLDGNGHWVSAKDRS